MRLRRSIDATYRNFTYPGSLRRTLPFFGLFKVGKIGTPQVLIKNAQSYGAPPIRSPNCCLSKKVYSMFLVYRRRKDSLDPEWHFHTECSRWPKSNFIQVRFLKPDDSRFCGECAKLETAMSVRRR
jgi:hypothetical protein